MKTNSKTLEGCLLILLVILLHSQEAKADVVQDQDKLSFSSTESVLPEELDNARGREGVDLTTLNNMNVRATLSGNQANNIVNGYNIIDHGAFAQASGINSVIQNTGNNVIIQDSTILNVTIVP
ncbi:MAG TPA: hypothetical protein VIF10_16210 [Methylobacter sp.]|jgi:hypothetical protein